ncbi:MAG: hypothetical protein BWY25_00169 [Chloroflexi bacterium ADurb.Bin222]|nr:MAG: hypothetical protein BWY25_00169 [Chloroflexi bacterium ADurb.Bin222]
MHAEDGLTPANVRLIQNDAPIEASRPQQCRIEDVRPVGRRDHDHVGVRAETVHLHENLIERLLALIVGTAKSRAAITSDGVNLIHEHDAGAVTLGLVEEVAHAAGPHADEHLDEL